MAAAAAGSRKLRVVICPGNGCVPVTESNWYAEAQRHLLATRLFSEVALPDNPNREGPGMPDPHEAKEAIWLAYLREEMEVGPDTVLIGHSSGAEAAMRLLESGTKVAGCVLVASCHTDLGVESEAAAGYYNRPWQWDTIRANAGFIVSFHSRDDPLVPFREGAFVAKALGLRPGREFLAFDDREHFWDYFPELTETITKQVLALHERRSHDEDDDGEKGGKEGDDDGDDNDHDDDDEDGDDEDGGGNEKAEE